MNDCDAVGEVGIVLGVIVVLTSSHLDPAIRALAITVTLIGAGTLCVFHQQAPDDELEVGDDQANSEVASALD